jgi:phosphinothricin acetyltransferase
MIVRHASKEDCAAIGEIYNHAVLHTAAIWNDKTVDTDNRIAWFEARTFAGYPVLVSEEDGTITGYASFGDWRAFDGFRHTVEHSVYVHPAIRERDWPHADESADYRGPQDRQTRDGGRH